MGELHGLFNSCKFYQNVISSLLKNSMKKDWEITVQKCTNQIPGAILKHYNYCPRLFPIIFIDSIFTNCERHKNLLVGSLLNESASFGWKFSTVIHPWGCRVKWLNAGKYFHLWDNFQNDKFKDMVLADKRRKLRWSFFLTFFLQTWKP